MEYVDLKTFILNYSDVTDAKTTFNEKLINMLQTQRDSVNKQVFNFGYRLQDVNNLMLVQSEIFNLRQQILEDIHIILDKINVLNNQLYEIKSKAIEEINKSLQIRYQSSDERNQVILGKPNIRELVQRIEILTNYSIFLKDTMGTLDGMKFAVRNVLDMNTTFGAVPKH